MPVRKQSGFGAYAGKLALGAALVLAVAYSLWLAMSQKDAQVAVNDVKATSASLQLRLDARGDEALPPIRDKDSVLKPWLRVLKPREEANPWIFERQPDLIAKVEKPLDNRKELYPPVELQARVLPDFKVELAWKPDPRTTAKVKGYDIFRWKEGAEPPAAPLSERLLDGPPFTDEDYAALVPQGSYRYAVRVRTEDEVKQGEKTALSVPAKVTLPDDRSIEYYGEGGIEMASLYVKRFHQGRWLPGRFNVYLGDPVGAETVVEASKDEKIRLDFSTPWLLAEIGSEVTVRKEIEKVQKLDEKGRPKFGADGKPEEENREVERKVVEEFVVLVDGEGAPLRVTKTERPVLVEDEKEPGEDDPFFDHKKGELKKRLKEAKEPGMTAQLGKRIKFLDRWRSKLVAEPAVVDDNLLKNKVGLLFDLRLKWLEAADRALKFRNRPDFQREADELLLYIKDLESFLSPAGWDKEKEEWELDRDFLKSKNNGREAPQWTQMPEKPDKPKNTAGKKKG